MFRLLPVFSVVVVAVSAQSASAQHVVYPAPVVYQQPAYVYNQPVFGTNFTQPAVIQQGQWFNRPLMSVPASSHPISQPFYLRGTGYDPDRVFGGSPFQSRPVLNIAIGLALR